MANKGSGDHVTEATLRAQRGEWAVEWDSSNNRYILSHPHMGGPPMNEVRCDRAGVRDLQWCLTTIKEARQRDLTLRKPNEEEKD